MKYPFGLIVLLFLILSSQLKAEEIRTPVGQQMINPSLKMPAAGLSQATVATEYGTPVEKMPAVGTPPIARWIYKEYTVYFEYDRVIHSAQHPQ